jgi:hypothetical protein
MNQNLVKPTLSRQLFPLNIRGVNEVFSQVISYLSIFAKENRIVITATYSPYADTERNSFLPSESLTLADFAEANA